MRAPLDWPIAVRLLLGLAVCLWAILLWLAP